MTGYTVSLQGNITGFQKVSSAIQQYNSLASTGTNEQTTFATAVGVTNGKLGAYLTGLAGTKASMNGYVTSLVRATTKTIALKVATIALNSYQVKIPYFTFTLFGLFLSEVMGR